MDIVHQESAGETLAAQVANRVSAMIIRGELMPGQRLNIKELADLFAVGQTPLREGLSRLIATGLVSAVEQRGFRVANMGYEDLRDIIDMRLAVELGALQRSMERGDDAWEASVVAALHRLKKFMVSKQEPGTEAALRFDSVHKAFHLSLVAACGSPRMLQTVTSLYDQGFRYRCMMLSNAVDNESYTHSKQRADEHIQLAELVVARDIDAAKAVLFHHLDSVPEEIFQTTGSQASS